MCQFSLIYTQFDNISSQFLRRHPSFLDDESNLDNLLFRKYSKLALSRISEKFILRSFLSKGSFLRQNGSAAHSTVKIEQRQRMSRIANAQMICLGHEVDRLRELIRQHDSAHQQEAESCPFLEEIVCEVLSLLSPDALHYFPLERHPET
jgi:hypothetical protein